MSASKRSESHVLLERKNHIMQISKIKYKKQNKKKINNKRKIALGASLSRKKGGFYNTYYELLSKK